VLRVDLDGLDGVGSLIEPRSLHVDTPAGPWSLRLSVDGLPLPVEPTTLTAVSDGLLVGRWSGSADVELSMVLVDFLAPARRLAADRFPDSADDGHLDGAWGVLLRVAVLQESGPVELTAALPTGTVSSPEGGQYLVALHVEEGPVHLTFGGADEEGLEEGAVAGWLPSRWAGSFAPDLFTRTQFGIAVVDAGLRWRLPGGEGGDRYELAVAAVWGRSDIATWGSVGDVNPPYLAEVIEERLTG
jgi:hypothetical protein